MQYVSIALEKTPNSTTQMNILFRPPYSPEFTPADCDIFRFRFVAVLHKRPKYGLQTTPSFEKRL